MEADARQAVLITGVYGAGNTAVTEEMAALLEAAGVRYAAVDLDWLAWANLDDHGPESDRVLLANLAAVVDTYRRAGITHFVLAGSVERQGEVDDLRRTIGMPMSVVRLTAPIEVIEQRLARDPTSGRRDDLDHARRALAVGAGATLADVVVSGDRPLGEVADAILSWLGWEARPVA
jgi:adenylylsulfate kinase-like enzyme